MFEGTEPRTLLWWLIIAAVVYLVVPFDLVPDFFGIPGRADDLAAIVALAWFYRNHVKQYLAQRPEQRAAGGAGCAGGGSGPGAKSGPSGEPGSARTQGRQAFDPYAVLGLAPSASKEEVRAAYRKRMQEYHPDKVAHLGEALQKVAHEKSQEIQRAYRELGG